MFRGLTLKGTSSKYLIVTCPPNNVTCSAAYTNWNDDQATYSCRNNNSLILTLCSTVSDLKALEEAHLGGVKEVVATDILTATATATSCSTQIDITITSSIWL